MAVSNPARHSLFLGAGFSALGALGLLGYFHWHVDTAEMVDDMIVYSLAPWLSSQESAFLALWWVTAIPATLLVFAALSPWRPATGRALRELSMENPRQLAVILSVLAGSYSSLPATLLALAALRPWWPAIARALRELPKDNPRQLMVIFGVLAGLASLALRRWVLLEADFTDDERMYWYEALSLLSGHVTGELVQPAAAFDQTFLLLAASGDRLAGVYPIGQPALLALGTMVHFPHLGSVLAVGGTVVLTGLVAERVFSSPHIGALASALAALSPMLLLVGATRHNVVPATFFLLLSVWAGLEVGQKASHGRAALAGAAVGATWLCRPDDGLIAVAVIGVLWIHAFVTRSAERGRLWVQAGIGAAALLPFVVVQLASYSAVTGSALVTPYHRWLEQKHPPGARLFGFGVGPWGIRQDFPRSIGKTLMALVRTNQWAFGWPLSLGPAAAAAVIAPVRRAGWPLILATLLNLLVCWAFMTAAVNDFGSTYHTVSVPFVAALSAAALSALAERISIERVATAVLAALIVTLVTFWPLQLVRLNRTARRIAGPLEVAAQTDPHRNILVLWTRMQGAGPNTSCVFFPPPYPEFARQRVVWAKDDPAFYPTLAANFADRAVYRLEFSVDDEPRISPATLLPPTPPVTR